MFLTFTARGPPVFSISVDQVKYFFSHGIPECPHVDQMKIIRHSEDLK